MRLKGKRVAYLVEDGFEDLEFWVPLMRLREEGAQVTVIGTGSANEYTGKHCLKAKPDTTADKVTADSFDALIIPGGWAPDKLRRYDSVIRLVREFNEQGKLVEGKIIGVICHGGLVPASAEIIKGRRVTGSLGIRDDLLHVGAEWVDAPAFRDGNMVWGRVVEDIPDFCRELVAAIEG
jgi:protease I